MYLMIDSHDSFVWNLVRYLRLLDQDVTVVSSDELSTESLLSQPFQGVIVSPGPGRPQHYPQLLDFLRRASTRPAPLPILGVCLGMQALCVASGGRITHGARPMHGKVTPVWHRQEGVFQELPSPLKVTRYHSLVVDPASLPRLWQVTAQDETGTIMGMRHSHLPQEGVQFHPEAELSECGLKLLQNFLRMAKAQGGKDGR